mgnify:CR=1 FL=1
MEQFLEKVWHSKFNIFSLILLPFSLLYFLVTKFKLYLYEHQFIKRYKSQTPLVIIGNITVGGTGKTPFVIWLANHLSNKGKKVGIISSGYKASLKTPTLVTGSSDPTQVGDEAVLIAKKTNCEVVSCGNRVEATKFITQKRAFDVLLHDDGIQHYKLDRDYEIILINNNKLLGNGLLLPAGPLRESKSRLETVDIVIYTNNNKEPYSISSINNYVVNLASNESKNITDFSSNKVHLVSGIASIDAIIENLENNRIQYISHKYDDHHMFNGSEVIFDDNYPVFITQKDCVKLSGINNKNVWVIDHKIELSELLITKLDNDLTNLLNI